MFLVTALAALLGVATISPDFVAGLITSALPAGGGFPAPVHAGAVLFGRYMASMNFILPVDTLVSILFIAYNVIILGLVWYFIRYFAHLVRGVNTNKFVN